jgi:hypothetical protein
MSRRPPFALLGLGAAAAVVAVAWWLPAVPMSSEAAEAPTESLPQVPPAWPNSGLDGVDDVAEDLPALPEDHQGLTDEELWAHISDPANSDLPSELFAELSQLGIDYVRADATGEGRDRWPDHWPEGARADPCCTDITIHAAGASRDPAMHDLVLVTVVWSSESPTDAAVSRRFSRVALHLDGPIWRPLRYEDR